MLVRRCEWSSLTQWLTGPSPLPIVIIDSSGELKHTEPQAAAETQNRIYMFTIFPRLFLYTFIFKKWKRLRCFLISSWQLFSSWSLGPFWLLWQKSHGLGGVQTADFLSCNSGVWESKVSSDRGPLLLHRVLTGRRDFGFSLIRTLVFYSDHFPEALFISVLGRFSFATMWEEYKYSGHCIP